MDNTENAQDALVSLLVSLGWSVDAASAAAVQTVESLVSLSPADFGYSN